MKIYHEDTKREPFGREGFQAFLRELRALASLREPIFRTGHMSDDTDNDENGRWQ